MSVEMGELKTKLSKMNQLIDSNPNKFQPNFEEDKEDVLRVQCEDCISKINIKAELECKHFICKDCLIRELMEKFCRDNDYSYKVFCKECNIITPISILFL